MSKKKSVTDRTFQCRCGHLAYWVKRDGFRCMCAEPSPKEKPTALRPDPWNMKGNQ